MGNMTGRTALVTGGARGQGRSHALALAREGCDVVLCDIAANMNFVPYPLATPADLEETVSEIEALDRRAFGIVADMRDTAQVQGVVDAAIAEFGKIDILIANHGVIGHASVEEMSDEMWDDLLDTNLTGIFKVMRSVIPHMRANGYGRIVATSSSIARSGRANVAGYAAAKWGVLGLIKSCAQDLAGTGITVNALLPTSVATDMILNAATYKLFCPDLENPTREDFESRAKDQFGPGFIQASDVTRAMMYLVSDDSAVMNGQGLDITGGMMSRMPI